MSYSVHLLVVVIALVQCILKHQSLFAGFRFMVHLNEIMRYTALGFVPWFIIYCLLLGVILDIVLNSFSFKI